MVAAVVLLAIDGTRRSWHRARPLPLGGVAIAAAGAWTISRARPLPAGLLLAVVGVAAVATASARWRWSFAGALAMTAPFALAVGFHAGVPGATWVRILVVAVASVGALLVVRCDAEWSGDALGPPLLGLTLLGVYFTVPDTEEAAGLLAAALPVAALGWPLRRVVLGPGGAGAATVLLAWTAAVAGVGRPASIVGASACLGLLVGLPLGRRLVAAPARPGTPDRSVPAAVAPVALLVHLLLVTVGSRVAGLRDDATVSASIAVLVLFAAVALGSVLGQAGPALADGPDRRAP